MAIVPVPSLSDELDRFAKVEAAASKFIDAVDALASEVAAYVELTQSIRRETLRLARQENPKCV